MRKWKQNKGEGKREEGGGSGGCKASRVELVECLPSTISLGGRHSDMKNWDPPDGRKRSFLDKGI